ncbi:hypothetical protein CONPUDRAFT_146018 [Coniophora puteana RWD-64-598 SS2]|uniref:C2H2-type domain-containing protein n=1 Tax=Coniophora puteana (strain RWD-64-598) TaxID=741705 RepID=A0A5M3MFV4_CONPW|nr:uncharacterized protein CONPUDRAFT_146018 [Coniophora puteana RWD-64-598 SS2]EIW77917.1 hypothetical protein CONPUDRAFT_146018 [Coniophora puteana RWD-64-598 SS2]
MRSLIVSKNKGEHEDGNESIVDGMRPEADIEAGAVLEVGKQRGQEEVLRGPSGRGAQHVDSIASGKVDIWPGLHRSPPVIPVHLTPVYPTRHVSMAATSQPIAFSVADNSSDIYMTSGSYRSRNGSISASYYMGSPTSWRAGSFGSRFYPGCSPGQLLGPLDPSEFKCAKMSSSLESDSGLMSVLGAPEREDEFCKNYSCCGLQIDDLHGLLQHVEEIHGSATDVFGNPQPIVSVCPTPIRTQSSYFPDTPLQTSSHGSFDPDDMDLDDEDQSSTPSSSNGPTPPDTPISTPLLSHPINSFNHYVSSKLSDAHIPVSPFAFPSSRSTPPIGSITPEAFNGYAGYTDYSSSMPGTVPSPRASEEPSQPASPVSDPGSPYGCLPPSLVFSATTTPANTPAHSRVPSPSSATRASVPATVGVQASTSSDSAAGPSVVAKASGSSSSAQSSARASTTLSRPSSSLLLSKPFRCPKLNCNKSYKQANGLKYHLTHGSCNFAPPKDLEQVQALLASKRSQREAAGEQNAQITEGEMREVEREAERRLRPFACGISDCQRRYKNMNGLRYHYQHSGDHGSIGLSLLSSGQHECLQHAHSKSAASSRHSTPLASGASTPVGGASTPTYAQQYQQQMLFQSAQQQQYMRTMQVQMQAAYPSPAPSPDGSSA